jgi:hypothetical protein
MFFLGKKLVDNSGKMRDDGRGEKSSYYMVRMEDDNDNLFEWYVPLKDNEVMVEALNKVKKFSEVQVLLQVAAYQGKPRVDLVGMAE